MKLPRWQFITQGKTPTEHLSLATAVVEAGCPWVQLRMKDSPKAVIQETAIALQTICQANDCLLTINDDIHIAKEVGADGVHLGLQDMPPSEARALWPNCPIIGGTANSWSDVQYMHQQGVDYIGMGPFRFTTTKKKLSPVLGLAGYIDTLQQMKTAQIDLPVFAIGGIKMADVSAIMQTAVQGVAVSGLLAEAQKQGTLLASVKAFNKILYS